MGMAIAVGFFAPNAGLISSAVALWVADILPGNANTQGSVSPRLVWLVRVGAWSFSSTVPVRLASAAVNALGNESMPS